MLNGSGASSGAIFSPSPSSGESIQPFTSEYDGSCRAFASLFMVVRVSVEARLFSSCGARTSVWQLLVAGHGLWGALAQ